MKAKEILSLCVNEQQLTQDEVLSSFTSYFTKKLNTTGLDFIFKYRPYLKASVYIEKTEEITEREISSYLNRLSKVITNCSKEGNRVVNVHYVDSIGVTWDRDSSIFYLLGRRLSLGVVVFDIGVGASFERYLYNIEEHPEFATEESLRAMYARINDVAKAVRLVSFGG